MLCSVFVMYHLADKIKSVHRITRNTATIKQSKNEADNKSNNHLTPLDSSYEFRRSPKKKRYRRYTPTHGIKLHTSPQKGDRNVLRELIDIKKHKKMRKIKQIDPIPKLQDATKTQRKKISILRSELAPVRSSSGRILSLIPLVQIDKSKKRHKGKKETHKKSEINSSVLPDISKTCKPCDKKGQTGVQIKNDFQDKIFEDTTNDRNKHDTFETHLKALGYQKGTDKRHKSNTQVRPTFQTHGFSSVSMHIRRSPSPVYFRMGSSSATPRSPDPAPAAAAAVPPPYAELARLMQDKCNMSCNASKTCQDDKATTTPETEADAVLAGGDGLLPRKCVTKAKASEVAGKSTPKGEGEEEGEGEGRWRHRRRRRWTADIQDDEENAASPGPSWRHCGHHALQRHHRQAMDDMARQVSPNSMMKVMAKDGYFDYDFSYRMNARTTTTNRHVLSGRKRGLAMLYTTLGRRPERSLYQTHAPVKLTELALADF